MRYLVDSDVLIDHLNGVETASQTIADIRIDGAAVSYITVAELYDGAMSSPNFVTRINQYSSLLSRFALVGLNHEIAMVFAQIRWGLRQQGNLIPDMDLLIAATALANDMTLVTRNVRHFNRVSGLHLYWNGEGI